uniref:Uncharacterized protein n=1 Tax=Anopheles dirus TaxID=7168 RepID=A0A182NYM7_9DIPT
MELGRYGLDWLAAVGAYLLIDHPLVETLYVERMLAGKRPSVRTRNFLQADGAIDVFISRRIICSLRFTSCTITSSSVVVLFILIVEVIQQTDGGQRYNAYGGRKREYLWENHCWHWW